jgi:3-hydroxyacyl-CoA dehydrogenase/enoyl-CoA hydratase/3-hydroxybutyryl-CoA epimerase
MGASIAYVTAAAGIPVTLIDRDMDAADKGKAHSEGLVKDSVGKGRLTQDEGAALLARITPSAAYGDLADATLVIEAVFEDRDVKKAVIERSKRCSPKAPSSPPTPRRCRSPAWPRIQAPGRVHRHPFLLAGREDDADRGHRRQEDRRQGAGRRARLRRRIKKTPIVVNDTRGFFVNRCVLRYIHEAYDMLIEGVPPAMIENAAKMAGMPVGPLSLNDEVAIDLSARRS